MHYKLRFPKDKIIFKLAILIAIEVLLVVGSFGISTYIESQSTAIGNTINLAGKNRYLTSNLLLQFKKVNDGTAQMDSLRNASDALNENISFLRSGGIVTPSLSSSASSSDNIFLNPLSTKYFAKWNEINEKRIALNRYVELIGQWYNTSGASTGNGRTNEPQLTSSSSFAIPREIFNDMTGIETAASQLIASSDDLTRQLSEDDRMNSQNLVSMQTIFIIAIILVAWIILYVMKRLLQPLALIIEATKEVRKGNLSIAPIANCNGKDEIGILAASFNSMINQLAEYDRMQKQFISIASHELRTPLQPILGLSDMLRSSVGNNKEAQQLADKIYYNARRLQSIIDNVLEATRIEKQLTSLNKERIGVYDLLEYVIKDARYQVSTSNKNIRLELFIDDKHNSDGRSDIADHDLAKTIFFVDADRARLTQVFTNLLNNAIKFTKEGVISITLKKQRDTKGVVFLIKDTGTGIPSDRFPRLFARFGTESVTGTGLGLFISKSIVEAHGGTIWGQNNEDGIGATFGFTLPSLSEEERAKTKLQGIGAERISTNS